MIAPARTKMNSAPDSSQIVPETGASVADGIPIFKVYFIPISVSYQCSAGVPKNSTSSAPAPRNVPKGNS